MVQYLRNPNAEFELGYWAIRGLAQPIRFLFAYRDVPFAEVRLGVRPDGTLMDRDEESRDWAGHRKDIDFPFPNLPYLIDRTGSGEIRLTQSNAILRHLGRRFDLYGADGRDHALIDVLLDEAYDYRNWIIDTCYVDKEDYLVTHQEFVRTAIPRYLDGFERYLDGAGGNSHFVDSGISIVDFVLYELLWQTTQMVPGSISDDRRPALHAFIRSMAVIPTISRYMSSDNYIERPINSPWAAFC